MSEQNTSVDSVSGAPEVTKDTGGESLTTASPSPRRHFELSAYRDLLVGRNRVLGELASWGVQQSPYTVPDSLQAAIEGFKAAWPRDEYATFYSQQDLRYVIRVTFNAVPEIMAWNERKNGNKSQFGFSSRYDHPNPDDDFIDLDALAQNIAMCAWRDAADFKQFNDEFDSRNATGSAQ